MSCDSGCYNSQVNTCSDLLLKAGLELNTNYFIQLAKSGKTTIHQALFTSDGGGNVEILQQAYPDGFFTPGFYKLTVKKESDFSAQTLTFGGDPYSCVMLEIRNIINELSDDPSPTTTIQ